MDVCENGRCELDLSRPDSGLDLVQVDFVAGNKAELQQSQQECGIEEATDSEEIFAIQEEENKRSRGK